MPAETPDWLETPAESAYKLLMLPGGEEECTNALQEIELTRDEYDALKTYLAMKRGFGIGDFRSEFAAMMEKGPEGYGIKGDQQQAARHLETARDFYRHCPDLVVYESDELDTYLEELGDQ